MILDKQAIDFLNNELKLPYEGFEQDWDIELSNPNRLEEFILFYETKSLRKKEKKALMALIIASYEDHLNKKNIKKDDLWLRIKKLLVQERELFTDLINYWSVIESQDGFKIGYLMNEL